MSATAFLPLKDGHLYRLRCGAVVSCKTKAYDPLHCNMNLLSWDEVDRHKIWGGHGSVQMWIPGEFPYYYHRKNGRVDVDRPGHPLNVVEEIEP